jgi:hypothetical protein
MGRYHYDESGSMAGYFVLTFLALGLVPLSISAIPSSSGKECEHALTRQLCYIPTISTFAACHSQSDVWMPMHALSGTTRTHSQAGEALNSQA